MKKVCLLVVMLVCLLKGNYAQSMYGDAVKADVKMKYVYSFEEALQKARETGKPIFFNCFADWAVPCHGMNQHVFSDSTFADWMDRHFVNFFIDVTTKEGRPFAEKYNARTMAHYLVLDAQGEIVHRIVGGSKLPEFQEILEKALNPKTSLAGMNKRYDAGERTLNFLREYISTLRTANESDKADKITDDVFDKLKPRDWSKKENWPLVSRKIFSAEDELFRYLVEHKKDFVKSNGQETINKYISNIYGRAILSTLTGQIPYDAKKFNDYYQDLTRCEIPEDDIVYGYYEMAKLRGEGNYTEMIRMLEDVNEKWPDIVIGYVDFSLKDFQEADPKDKEIMINYLEERLKKMSGSSIGNYREVIRSLGKNEGIRFETLTFAEALVKAEKEEKLIFMDCYTTWCGPCKILSSQVFTQKAVGDFFNQHFINLKVDMEAGEGIELRKRYGVKAYPTMLLINGKGEVVYKILGMKDPRALLEMVARGMEQATPYIQLHPRYDAGERSVDFMADYFIALSDAGELRGREGEVFTFLTSLSPKEKISAGGWRLLEHFVSKYSDPEVAFLVKNRKEFAAFGDETTVNKMIERILFPPYIEFLRGDLPAEEIEKIDRMVESGKFDSGYSLALLSRLTQLYRKGKYSELMDIYETVVVSHPVPHTRLNLDVLLDDFMRDAPNEQKQHALKYMEKALKMAAPGAVEKYQHTIDQLK